ncbi:hypothetical protein ACWNXI_16330 [Caldibacillus thermoamylovorans]
MAALPADGEASKAEPVMDSRNRFSASFLNVEKLVPSIKANSGFSSTLTRPAEIAVFSDQWMNV